VVEQTLRIDARPETVWRYWTDPARVAQWWGEVADLDPTPGGPFRVEMERGGPTMSGEYVELVPHERLVFSFGWEEGYGGPVVPPGSSRVEVTLEEDGGGTVLTLRHTGLPDAHVDEHTGGWAHFLPRLVEAAEAPA
jgi:uncharacterized protein YndB with AHSA1/START domain